MTSVRVVRRPDGGWAVIPNHGFGQTAAGSVSQGSIAPDATRVIAATLTTEADELRYRSADLVDRAADVHQMTYMNEWSVRTQERAAAGVAELLESLADEGFAWRDIARLIGVSVPAIQKWRKGGSVSSENRHRLASLTAACDFILRHRKIDDIGQWFEMPLVQGSPLSPMEIWADGQYGLVFEFALQHLTGEAVMDRYQPDWRERYDTDFEVVRAGDGELSIRTRDR